MAPATPDGNALTARDFDLLAGAMKCTKEEVKIDYVKYAERFGFKNAASGRTSWHSLRKKLDKMDELSTCGSPSLPMEPAEAKAEKGKGSKKRSAEEDNEESEAEIAVSKASKKAPAKKGHKAPTKKGKAFPKLIEQNGKEEPEVKQSATDEEGDGVEN